MSKPIYTIFDFETTGLNKPVGTDQVIEVAALRTDLEQDYGVLHLMVELEEGRVLTDFIKNYTGIIPEYLTSGVSQASALSTLSDFMGGTIAVAHHYPFDSSFFHAIGKHPEKFICTRTLVSSVDRANDFSASAALDEICARNGIELTKHHQAFADVRATAEVLKVYLPQAERLNVPYMNVLYNNPYRPLHFVPPHSVVFNP